MTKLVCPNCEHDQCLLSEEVASIGYPITVEEDDQGQRTHEYTGDSYTTYDVGTEFQDVLWCTGCGSGLKLAQLVPEARNPDDEDTSTDVGGQP